LLDDGLELRPLVGGVDAGVGGKPGQKLDGRLFFGGTDGLRERRDVVAVRARPALEVFLEALADRWSRFDANDPKAAVLFHEEHRKEADVRAHVDDDVAIP
jgi:hypothetical protein